MPAQLSGSANAKAAARTGVSLLGSARRIEWTKSRTARQVETVRTWSHSLPRTAEGTRPDPPWPPTRPAQPPIASDLHLRCGRGLTLARTRHDDSTAPDEDRTTEMHQEHKPTRAVTSEAPLPRAAPTPADATSTGPPVVISTSLLAGRREVIIRHGDEDYRLRITGNDKLILTK